MSRYSNQNAPAQPSNAIDFNWAANQLAGRQDYDLTCPFCSHMRKPENRRKKCFRLSQSRDHPGCIVFKCMNCGEGDILIPDREVSAIDRREMERKAQEARRKAEETARRKNEWLNNRWQRAQPPGPIARAYFASRLLPVPDALWGKQIRYDPCFFFRKENVTKPSILLPMRAVCEPRKITGLHVIALDVSRETVTNYRHDGEKLKRSYGLCGGRSAVMTGWPDDGRLAVCEGFETALGVLAMQKWHGPIWAFTGSEHLAAFQSLRHVSDLHIFADHDREDEQGVKAGCDAALMLENRYRRAGKTAVTMMPADEGADYADMACGRASWREYVVREATNV